MNPIVRNILAIILGVILGSIVNFALILLGSAVVAPPEGVDPMNMESIVANIEKFQPKHFVFPFLAHALGTLVGAFLAAKMAATHKMAFGFGVGVVFLAGGIMNTFSIPAPTWFVVVDLMIAYIPMAWLGVRLALRKKPSRTGGHDV